MLTLSQPWLQHSLEALRVRAADRPAHAAFLADLEAVTFETMGDNEAMFRAMDDLAEGAHGHPALSCSIAEALVDDLTFLVLADAKGGRGTSPPPNAYDRARLRAIRRRAIRAGTESSLGPMFRF